ncbi:immunoglobulin superfamily member 6 isoform X2 [Rhineura floridana]|uniref:immunoglobulin superfamily member 6 isoform X2 n=1 Tax=Rhineura floridana TaxID=261503 RepID=UPI002AC850E3|nr:immunoglobulin superfamily member 6 isoform X2 [Rhineura floridana]
MATVKESVLILLLEFTWAYCAGTDQCKVTVTQPKSMEGDPASDNIAIPCTFFADGCPTSTPTILWFRYLAHTHENLCTPECLNSTKFKVSDLTPNNQTSLEINKVTAEDSAIYVCGVAFPRSGAPTSKQTGSGTMLVIRETRMYSQGVHNTMLAISVLLFLYLVALLAVSKFFTKPTFKKTEKQDLKGKPTVSGKGSREAVCQAIAKEFCKKKHKRQRRHGRLDKSRTTDKLP